MADRELRYPSGIRGRVYECLDYTTGNMVADIRLETGLKTAQIRTALQGMEELGIVSKAERWETSYPEVLWFRVGASDSNNPFTQPS